VYVVTKNVVDTRISPWAVNRFPSGCGGDDVQITTDVTASCAFGIHANSLKDPNAELKMYARNIFDFSVRKGLAVLTAFTAPEVKNLLNIKFLDDDSQIPEEDRLEYSGI